MTVVVTPVGTSLFTNGSTLNRIAEGFDRIKDKSEDQWGSCRDVKDNSPLRRSSEQFIRDQKISASAELQSTAKIQNELNNDIIVQLLASDTIASRLAAEILSGNVAGGCLGRNICVNFDAGSDIISGLQVKNRQKFLREGMNALICRIEQINSTLTGGDQSLAINITGGYGATLPYLTIYAQLKSIPLYYNFEESNELIEIPPAPLSINWDAIGPHFEVLQKIEDAQAINNWTQFKNKQEHKEAINELGSFILVDQTDDSAYVSPLGEVFWDECLKRKHHVSFPDPVTIAPDEIEEVKTKIGNGISGVSHHRPSGWENCVNSLCENAYVKSVRYDSSVHGGQKVKLLDEGREGHIGVRYTKDDNTLPLRVETTACGKAQTELVMEYIKRQFKRQLNLKIKD